MALKHGMWNTRLYHIWSSMKQRCENPKAANYHYYGARGIKVCPEWHDPTAFFAWALSHGYQDHMTLDRKDNDGDYCPENCRWASILVQGRNKSTNHFVEYNGEVRCIAEWSEVTGIPFPTIWNRLNRGKCLDEVFSPPKKRARNIENRPIIVEYQGEQRTLKEWSEITGIPPWTLRERISRRGWMPERALTTPVQVKTKKG